MSTFYSLVDGGLIAPLRAFFLSLVTAIPEDVSIQVESAGDAIEDTTGDLTGDWSDTPVLPVDGTVTGPYAAPAGMLVDWLTGTILDGHRVKGRTFIVPSVSFDTDGSVLDATRTAFQANADTFIAAASGNLAVWHRPRAAKAAEGTHKAITAHAGGHAVVTSAKWSDQVVVLRSRRD